jgi:hypothetical protein
MNCETIDDLLLDLLYEEVEGDTKIQAEHHLSGCESCQQKFAAMGGVRRSFQSLPEPEMPMLGHQALLAEAAVAAKRYAQPEAKREEEQEGLWAKLRAGMKFLMSPPVAVAAGLLLVLTVSLSVNETTPQRASTLTDSQMAPTAAAEPRQQPAPVAAVTPTAAPIVAEPEVELAQNDPTPEKKPAKSGKTASPPAEPLADKGGADDFVNFDGSGEGGSFGATATPGVASASQFSTQSVALAKAGKCGDAEKTARTISAGSFDWCQGMQASAECFQQNQKLTETRNLYTEMQSFTNCAADAEKALASLNKSQVGGPSQGTKSTIRSEDKKKMKPSPAPKSIDADNTLSPFKKESKNVTF